MTRAAVSSDSPSHRPYRLPGWAGFTLALGLFWLGGQIVTQGVSDEFSPHSPELAALWRGDSADAVSNLARARLTGGDNSGAARLARRVLLHAPLDAEALSTYAVAQTRLGHAQAGLAAMQTAGGLGWRDLVVQISLLRSSLMTAQAGPAVLHLDAILRRQDPVAPALLQIVEIISHDASARQDLVARLAFNPNWRAPLFAYLSKDPRPDALVVYGQLLQMLAQTGRPPSSAESGPYLQALVNQGHYADARAAWRSLNHAKAASLVYNGDFASPAGGPPFDWSVTDSEGWSAQIDQSPGPGSGMALRVRYDGVSAAPPIQELVTLAPGQYQLSFQQLDELGDPGQALNWTVKCAGSGQVIAQQKPSAASPPADDGAWRQVTAVFAVPASGCDAQWLGITAQQGERPETAVRWYRRLAIAPLLGAGATGATER